MNIFKEYGAYLRNNPEGYWFKRKLYGWGWTPARWQGWAVTALYVLFVSTWLITTTSKDVSETQTVEALVPVLLATLVFLSVAWRTGESPKWQWGNREETRSK